MSHGAGPDTGWKEIRDDIFGALFFYGGVMRGTVAKRLRKTVYGDRAVFENVKTVEERSYVTASGETIRRLFTFWRREPVVDLRQAYQRAKREWRNGRRSVSP